MQRSPPARVLLWASAPWVGAVTNAAFSLGGIYVADWLEKQYPERNRRAGVVESSVSPELHGGENRTPRLFSISVVDHKQS